MHRVSCFRKPLICNVAGWWSNDLRKKIACPISSGISPANTYVRYNKECDDPSRTAEVQHQRAASLGQNDEKTEVPFKVNSSGLIISQASGTYITYLQILCIHKYTHYTLYIICTYTHTIARCFVYWYFKSKLLFTGLFEKRKMYTSNVDQLHSDIALPKKDTLGHCIEEKLDRFFSFFLMP